MKRLVANIVLLAALLIVPSCRQEQLPPSESPAGEEVEVLFSFGMESDGTRSVYDSEDISSIKNLCIIQYDGTSDEAKLLGSGNYLDESSLSIEGSRIVASLKMVSVNKQNTVFLIANSFNSGLVPPGTLGDMKLYSKSISSSTDLLGYDGANHHVIFSGWITPDKIEAGSELAATLSRNVAKLRLHLTNSSHNSDPKVTVKSVRICSAPKASYYFPTFGNPDIFPETVTSIVDYPAEEWPSSIVQGSASVSADFTLYLPVNKRGTVDNSSPSEKARFNPGNATYVRIECTYPLDGKDVPINYEYYLGGNLVNDFNIESNKDYSFNLEITGKGTTEKDSRIRDYGPVDYTLSNCERSNSYILNPPPTDDYWRSFYIPVDRINVFWGKTSPSYENNENYQLFNDSEWEVSVVWADFTLDGSNFRFEGGGSTYFGNGVNPVKVQVRKGASGNVVIGLKKKLAGGGLTPFLWSWHLWITDYSPDDVTLRNIRPKSGIYDYSVTGGKVNRYGGTAWESGIFKNSFIMDRNLGAPDEEYHSGTYPGTLYYQFGRKDPLYVPKLSAKISCSNPEIVETAESPARPLLYTIAHPDVYLIARDFNNAAYRDWTRGNRYNPESFDPNILWQDPNATIQNHGKSLFDPCPTGWKVPEISVFEDLTIDKMDKESNQFYYRKDILLPFSGWISCADGVVHYGTDNVLWSSNAYSVPSANGIYFGKHSSGDFSTPNYPSGKSYGYSVRCVTDN